MSDFNSSLPVRTQTNGDVVVEVADGTTPSQKLAVNSSGSAQVAGHGTAGTPDTGVVTIQGITGGTVVPVSGTVTAVNASVGLIGSVPPASATYIGGLASTSSPTLTATDLEPFSLTLAGALRVDGSAVTQPVSGTVTANQGGAPWSMNLTQISGSALTLGQTTMSASIPVAIASNQSAIPVSQSGTWTVGVSNLPTTVDTNYGTVGASTLRSAAQVGNATGAADFNAGATGAQTLRVVANQGAANATPWNENISQIAGAVPSASNALPTQIAVGGSFISSSNPLPVILDPAGAGTPKLYYLTSAALASGSSATLSQTVAGTVGFSPTQFYFTSEARISCFVQVETAAASGIFNIVYAGFNSSATPNQVISVPTAVQVPTGARIQFVITNNDLQASNIYATINGFQS